MAQVANLEVKAISFQLNSTRVNKTLIHASLDKISVQAKARQDAIKVRTEEQREGIKEERRNDQKECETNIFQ